MDAQGREGVEKGREGGREEAHVKRRHFFVWEMQDAEEVMMVPVTSAADVADVFTKALSEPRFSSLSKRLRGFFTM